jgi:hypothetical protein
MSPLAGTCTRASQDDLACSCSMYTNPTNVLEESAESNLLLKLTQRIYLALVALLP